MIRKSDITPSRATEPSAAIIDRFRRQHIWPTYRPVRYTDEDATTESESLTDERE